MSVIPKPGFIDSIQKALLQNYFNFEGRARRSEFFFFVLLEVLVLLIFRLPTVIMNYKYFFDGSLFSIYTTCNDHISGIFYFLYPLYLIIEFLLFLPSITVSVRRLHDIGKSGWFYLFHLIPLVGWIILLVWYCQDSKVEDNKYGPSPKYEALQKNDETDPLSNSNEENNIK